MSAVHPQVHTTAVVQRREELYGASRLKEAQFLKSNLTTDHIALISKEGGIDAPLPQSTTKRSYKGTLRHSFSAPVSGNQRRYQEVSHFDFRGDAAPINDEIYRASLTSKDYQHRQTRPLPPVKPDGNINLPDMNPRYWRDDAMASSLYATDFSDNKQVRQGVDTPEVAKERNDMRRRNVEDVRTTHFRFGNDPVSFNSETGLCYNNKKPLPAVGGGEQMTAAELTQKMLDQERDSAIFRNGDYNVADPKPDTTTFKRDFDATTTKPYKSAAFIEPTRTQKGRFLADSPLRKSVMEEERRYPGLPPSENKLVDLAVAISALKQRFLQYDINRSGYVNKSTLKRVCDSLLNPVPPLDIEEIIKHTARNTEGDLDYQSFIDKFIDFQTKMTDNTDVNRNVESLYRDYDTTSSQSNRTHPNNERLGKEYQSTAHFKFGNDADNFATIYKKDFQQSKDKREFSARKTAPPSSEVMHKLPCAGFGESTKQSDFVNFKAISPSLYQAAIAATDEASNKNKRRHALNNVILAGDREKEAEERQKSLSHSSYIPHSGSQTQAAVTAPTSRYNFLHSNDALPHPTNAPKHSETAEAFARAKTRSSESKEELREFISSNNERSKDGKRAHFALGNDSRRDVSEAMEQFRLRAQEEPIPPAGWRNQDDPGFAHQQVSKNTQDLLWDPMAPSTFQTQRMVKKSYYDSAPHPKDPLHVNLRSRLMEIDSEKLGRMDKSTIKAVCSEFQIPVSDYAINNLLQRCESDFDDGTVDYHKFVRSLTLEQVPDDVSAAHSHSVMMNDYKPLHQRSFTNAQLLTMNHIDRKPLNPMPTHFFHVDGSGENQFRSMTSHDFVKPELQV